MLPKLAQELCANKTMFEVEAALEADPVTMEEYNQYRVNLGLTRRRRRATKCNKQCSIDQQSIDRFMKYLSPNSPNYAKAKRDLELDAFKNSIGIACTHKDFGSCNNIHVRYLYVY
mgnify:CR=1 FL=1